MPSGFLNADDGAYLVCQDCGAQVRENEYHHCEASPCECCLPGQFCCGIPGIIARVKNSKLIPDTKVERCDHCRRYSSDAAARAKLVELGIA